MIAAIICREMGWTWQQYHNQPSWFIDILLEMFQAENHEAERRTKETKNP